VRICSEVLLSAVFTVVFWEGIKRLFCIHIMILQFKYELVIPLWNVENIKYLLSFFHCKSYFPSSVLQVFLQTGYGFSLV